MATETAFGGFRSVQIAVCFDAWQAETVHLPIIKDKVQARQSGEKGRALVFNFLTEPRLHESVTLTRSQPSHLSSLNYEMGIITDAASEKMRLNRPKLSKDLRMPAQDKCLGSWHLWVGPMERCVSFSKMLMLEMHEMHCKHEMPTCLETMPAKGRWCWEDTHLQRLLQKESSR